MILSSSSSAIYLLLSLITLLSASALLPSTIAFQPAHSTSTSQSPTDIMSSGGSASALCAEQIDQVGYDRSTERADSFILPTLQKAFGSDLKEYEIIGDKIIQPNAVGMKLRLPKCESDDDDDKCWPELVFMKQVLATDYVDARQDWNDLRRTLLYARTELRFYRDMLPIMNQKGFHAAPKAYHVHYDFEGWIAEEEHATKPADESIDKNNLPNPLDKGGWLILECISEKTHMQDSPLSMDRAKQCLKAAAELHASAWEDKELLSKASEELSRSAFNLQMRNPKELAGIENAWNNFLTNFQSHLEADGLWTESIRNLGKRMKAVAEQVSKEVTPSPNDKYASIIHGDYKAMNVMMGIDENTPTIMIDMASASAGLGMSDVAMHIHHAVNPEDLDNGGEERLVDYYLQTLADLKCDYPKEIAMRHYKLCVIDYARFFMGRMWKSATPETMAQKANNKNIANINSSVPSAMRFVKVVDRYLSEVEETLKA